MKAILPVLIIALTGLLTASSATIPDHARTKRCEASTGIEAVTLPPGYVPPRHLRPVLDDGTPGSTYHTIGTTWYDFQQYGTCGKMTAVDAVGLMHSVWTNGLDESADNRHVYYNVWDPETEDFTLGTGVQVNIASVARYATVAVNHDGFAFPVFQEQDGLMSSSRAAAAIDFLPGAGAFTVFRVPFEPQDAGIFWNKVDVDIDGNLQVVGSEFFASPDFHAVATPVFDEGFGISIDWGEGFRLWDPATSSSMDVAASRHSPRVAVAWIRDLPGAHDGENVFLRISEDGGENWADAINVTGCLPVDTMCVPLGGDIPTCNGDTIRPWLDLSVIFDDDDNVHIAFTGNGWYYWDESGDVGPYGVVYSSIWHWGEDREEYNIIAEAWYAHADAELGVNNVMCQRPNLALDTTSGYLYCSYQQFDQVQVSQGGYASGDAWVSVSTDNGRAWSAGINVTGTDGGIGTPPGECLSERDINLAKYVTDGIIHMQYLMDRDNGSGAIHSPEGTPTLNDMIYQRIPVEDIPTRPLINPFRAFRADSTGYPWDLDTTASAAELPHLTASEFVLHQNYPNPFNPTTRIQFDLQAFAAVTLTIHDVTGREVTRLLDHEALPGGTQIVNFDGSALSSGVYFYQLVTARDHQARKMILLK